MKKVSVSILQPLLGIMGVSRKFDANHKIEIRVGPDATLKELIEDLTRLYGARGRDVLFDGGGNIQSYILMLLNDKVVDHSEMHAIKLDDGDFITLLMYYAGG